MTEDEWKEAIGDFTHCIHCSAPIVREVDDSGLIGGIECANGHLSSHKWLVPKQRELYMQTIKKRENFWQLCKKCHIAYDDVIAKRKKHAT